TLTLLDTIAADNDIVEDIDLRLKVRRLYDVLGKVLTDREKEIIVLRYGLSGERPMVQREVARKLHISRSYISRLEKKALEKLRKQFSD
ncbi:MAG: sigma-70 family RNA polymerase sigma factor, partial [Clostridia bacterium]|nr:sigma-70 family RNA polymerase sigma factor [Clostridia bacterium]